MLKHLWYLDAAVSSLVGKSLIRDSCVHRFKALVIVELEYKLYQYNIPNYTYIIRFLVLVLPTLVLSSIAFCCKPITSQTPGIASLKNIISHLFSPHPRAWDKNWRKCSEGREVRTGFVLRLLLQIRAKFPSDFWVLTNIWIVYTDKISDHLWIC